MSSALSDFVALLDRDELRGKRPSDFIFLCGGYSDAKPKPPYFSLRDYLLRHPTFTKKLSGHVVLAEDAQRIFDGKYYDDLITFEEDIARIASLIAIIAESPGSFSELGSFSSIPLMAARTCAIQQTAFKDVPSFITLGPIKRLEENYPESVAYYPWKKNSKKVFHTTCKGHVSAIRAYLNERIEKKDETFKLRSDRELELIFFVLWVVHIFGEISIQKLYSAVKAIFPDETDTRIRAKLFALQVSRWIGEEPYSGKRYYYTRFDVDPFEYRFLDKGNRIDNLKLDLVKAVRATETIPPHVRAVSKAERERSAK